MSKSATQKYWGWNKGSRTVHHDDVQLRDFGVSVSMQVLEIYFYRWNDEIQATEEEVTEVLEVEIHEYYDKDGEVMDIDSEAKSELVYRIDNLTSGDWVKIIYN